MVPGGIFRAVWLNSATECSGSRTGAVIASLPRRGCRTCLWIGSAGVAAGALGNMGGTATNALLFFSLRGDAFTVAVVASLLTGALGGWLAAVVGRRVATVCRRETNAPTREGLAGTERR